MNEKRYFKTRIKSKRALQLFDLINHHSKTSAWENDFSSFEKNYLLKAILKTLREFHSEMSVNRKLDDYIQEIDILINKEVFDLAKTIIKQAEKLAINHEKQYHRILLIKLKKRIEQYTGEDNFEKISEYYNEIGRLHELLNTDHKLEKMISIYRKEAYITQNLDLEDEFSKLMKGVHKNVLPEVEASYLYLRTKSFVKFHKGSLVEAHKSYKALVSLFDTKLPALPNSTLDHFSVLNYNTMLHGFLTVLKELDNEKEYFEIIEILKKSIGGSERDNNKNLVNMCISLTDYFLRKNEIRKGVVFLEEYKAKIERIAFEPDRMELLYFNMTYLYFGKKMFREAHRFVFKYILYKNPEYKNVYKTAYFIYILIQIELHKLDTATSLLNKYEKKLNMDHDLNRFDELLIKFIRYFFIQESKTKAIEIYKEFLGFISHPKNRKASYSLNNNFNFNGWMESKLLKSPFVP